MFGSKRSGSSIVAFAALLATAVSAQALDPDSVKVGRWTVWSNADFVNPAACAAIVENGKAPLRLLTDGRSWKVGLPYYGPSKQVRVYYGFEVAGEQATLTWDGSGWAMMPIVADQLAAFRELPTFAFTLGKAEYTWDLRGDGPAIEKAIECSRNRGLKPVAAAPKAAPPMAAPPLPQEAPPLPSAAPGACPPKGSIRSQNSARPVTIKFHNSTKGPIDIMWIDYQGEWKKYHTMAPEDLVQQKSFATHPWLAVDAKGRCLGGVMVAEPNSSGEESANFYQIMEE